jgi:homoserine O-acetyltransferase
VNSQSYQKFAEIGSLTLTNGEKIINCKIGYRTFGKLNRDSSNIIIYPSWFEGTSEAISRLIETHNFIDTSKYYIIAFDALGNGVSTSPSNYNGVFPEFTIRDMVNSQYIVLTNYLGIRHTYAIAGGSMGSFQALEWAVAYPDFMEKVIAYSSTPKMTSYDLLWMNTKLEFLESAQNSGIEEKEIKRISDMMTAMIARTPEYVNEHTKIEEFPAYLASFNKEPLRSFTIQDYVAQLKAMMKHDISRDYKSMEVTAKNIKAELLIIVSETDMMVNPAEALRLADIKGCKKIILDNNCGHLAVSCELERIKSEIDQFLSKN